MTDDQRRSEAALAREMYLMWLGLSTDLTLNQADRSRCLAYADEENSKYLELLPEGDKYELHC